MVKDRPATLPELAAAVAGLLSVHRSMPQATLLDALASAGLDLGEDPEDRFYDLLDHELVPLFPVGEDRWALMPSLLAGRAFTHRLTPIEVEHDALVVSPDFVAMTVLLDDERFARLADGTELEESVSPVDGDNGDALWLPIGHLAALGVGAGDMVALRVSDAGLHLEHLDEADVGSVPPGWGARLEAVVGATRVDEPRLVEEVVWHLCADDEALFSSPLPPLDELLEQPEVARLGGQLAPSGFDFVGHRAELEIGRLERLHQLDRDQALTVLAVVRLFEQVEAGTEREATGTTVRSSLGQLAQPAVAEAVLVEALGTERDRAEDLARFAESLETEVPTPARASMRWLRAKAEERLGATAAAEADLRAALAMDPDSPLALLDLARYASDRGDAERGLALLQRAGVGRDDQLVELLERFRPTARTDLGRNDRCWCGSGRKYKQCHLGRETRPLEERATWLYMKARMYLDDGPRRMQLLSTAYLRSQHWPDDVGVWGALEDPLVADAVLFEGGAFAEFLDERGHLLPEDELLLAGQWLLAERSVHEVQDVQPGRSLTLRDVRTGDVHEVPEHTASRTLAVGDLFCARVLPAGSVVGIFGGLEPIAMGERAEIIDLLDGEPDPGELVTRLSARFAPPRLSNTEGDPLVLCEADLRVGDIARLARGLDDAYTRMAPEPDQDPDETVWVEHVTTMGVERIRATLRLAGDHLHVSVNSEARLDRVLAVLASLDPRVEVLEVERTAVDDLREAMGHRPATGPAPDSLLDSDDPEVVAMIEQMVRQHETAWVDESLPALGGVTPRQAAADPTRRGDLERLLQSFEGYPSHPGAMDVSRLRAELGL